MTTYAYDQRVPVALMGFGIRPGQYLTSASPADLAPTLALLAGIILPRAEGRSNYTLARLFRLWLASGP